MLATQVSHILSHSLKSHREPPDQRSLFFFYSDFQSICPHQIFLLVLATILTHINLKFKKKSVKNACLVISILLGSVVQSNFLFVTIAPCVN